MEAQRAEIRQMRDQISRTGPLAVWKPLQDLADRIKMAGPDQLPDQLPDPQPDPQPDLGLDLRPDTRPDPSSPGSGQSTSPGPSPSPRSVADGPPAYRMCRTIKTVEGLWREWTEGLPGQPSITALDKRWGTRWRAGRGSELQWYSLRQEVIREVDRLA